MKKIIIMVMAIISSMALQIRYSSAAYQDILNVVSEMSFLRRQFTFIQYYWQEANVISIILVLALYFVYKSVFLQNTKDMGVFVFSLFAGFTTTIGVSFLTNNSLWVFYEPFIATILLLGNVILFWTVGLYIKKIVASGFFAGSNNIAESNQIGKYMLILAILWLPYYVVYFPGNVFPDGLDQLNKFFRLGVWTKHHPPLSTIFMGVIVKFGRFLGSDNIGLGIYIVLQFVISIYAFAKVLCFLERYLNNKRYTRISLIYFAVLTIWPCYAVCMIKDTLFLDFVILYYVSFWEIILEGTGLKKNNMFELSFYGMMVCLLRNNGLYIIIATIPYIILCKKNNKKKVGCIFALTIIVVCICNKIIYPNMGITKGGTQEALSIPFQQTARYVVKYSEEVTDEEKRVIDGVLNYEQIQASYNPNVSDPVKGTYHWAYDASTTLDGEKEALKSYFKIWFSMFLKHPLCYAEATLNNTYEYFFIDATSKWANTGYYRICDDPTVDIDYFEFSYVFKLDEARLIVESLSELLRRTPLVGVLYGAGIYNIVFVFVLLTYLFNKKFDRVVILLPFLVLILTCLASPVNGAVRYLLPLMALMPLIIMIFLKDYSNMESHKNENIRGSI